MNKKSKEFGLATKAVIYDNLGRYLILKKSSEELINPNTYDLPGGRVEFGEKLEDTVVREVKEETGLDIQSQQIFNAWTFVKDEGFQLIGIDFISKLIGGNEELSDEHEEILWMEPEDIQKRSDFPKWLVETIKKAEKMKDALSLK